MVTMQKPQVVESIKELAQWRLAQNSPWGHGACPTKGKAAPRIGFVPTMGALHAGHLELVQRAKADCDIVVVSIFVNPFQFAPHEDFGKYPRTFERDLELLTSVGADLVFYPQEAEIYPHGRDNIISVVPATPLNDTLEGAIRPTFFRGVATVVLKLFNLVEPHVSFFGEKDYQQLQVIKALVQDLNVPVEIVGVPTVRESDGLALSSRNAYLNAEQRIIATDLHKALSQVKDSYESGNIDVQEAIDKASQTIAKERGWDLQYLKVCDGATLKPLTEFVRPFVVVVAAKLGEVRLIDNLVVR